MSEQKQDTEINLEDFLELELESTDSAKTSNNVSDTSLQDDIFADDFFSQLQDMPETSDTTNTSTPPSSAILETPDTKLDVSDVATTAATAIAGAVQLSKSTTPKADTSDASSTPDEPTLTQDTHTKPKPTSKKSKAIKKPKSSSTTKLLNDPKKLNMLVLGGIIILSLVAVALYYTLFKQDPLEQPSITPVVTQPQDTPANPEPATDTPTPSEEQATLINVDELVGTDVPDDPALVKEEIDRLKETDTQLAEQSQAIKEQITQTEELTAVTAERIANLEAQIALLEQQANQNPAQPTEQNPSQEQPNSQ